MSLSVVFLNRNGGKRSDAFVSLCVCELREGGGVAYEMRRPLKSCRCYDVVRG